MARAALAGLVASAKNPLPKEDRVSFVRPDPAYVDQVRAIVERELSGHAVDVYLFGSWARGEARRTSDIDVAVLPKGELAWAILSRLREALEESSVPYAVDVVDLREVSAEFRARVLREGVRWSA